jgi:hypothetical protein
MKSYSVELAREKDILTLTIEAVRTSETSVYSEATRHYIAEGSHLHTRRCEILKSLKVNSVTMKFTRLDLHELDTFETQPGQLSQYSV